MHKLPFSLTSVEGERSLLGTIDRSSDLLNSRVHHRGVLALFLAVTSAPSSIIRSSSALRLSFTAYINGVIPVVCKVKAFV